jgi:hypothetical protein
VFSFFRKAWNQLLSTHHNLIAAFEVIKWRELKNYECQYWAYVSMLCEENMTFRVRSEIWT